MKLGFTPGLPVSLLRYGYIADTPEVHFGINGAMRSSREIRLSSVPSIKRIRRSGYQEYFLDTLDGTLSPGTWTGDTVQWKSEAGPVCATLSDFDAIVAGGRRVTGAITIVQQFFLLSAKKASEVVSCQNSAPGLGVARANEEAPSIVEVVSRGNFYAGEAEDNELLAITLAIAAVCHVVSNLNYGAGLSEKRLPQHDHPCRWKPAEFITLAWLLDDVGDKVSVNGSTFIAQMHSLRGWLPELPNNGDPRLAISGEYRHPSLGKGLAVELSFCISLPLRAARKLASHLNLIEVNRAVGPPLFGAWNVDPTRRRLVFASFWPNVSYVPGLLPRIVGWSGERLVAVRDELRRVVSHPAKASS